jgi:L-iditol 2-dehydrogenase
VKYLKCITQDAVALLDMPQPTAGAGEIIVRMRMCGICGTDTLKVYGAYPKPQQLGHEVVGVVHEVGAGVTQFRVGERVGLAHHVPDYGSHWSRRGSETMDPQFKRSNIEPGGFAEYIRVPAEHVRSTVVPIPEHVPDMRAVFMEPLACCLRALDRVRLSEGDSALVVGVGAVGMLFVPLLRDRSVTTLAADVRAERIEAARRWGAAGGGVPGRDDLAALCRAHSAGRGVDLVILTVVNDAVLRTALSCVRDGGTILLFGGKPGSELTFAYWDAFLREINLITSYSATPDGLRRAMAVLAGPACAGLEDLVSHALPLERAGDGFEMLRRGEGGKAVVVQSII